ncbi:MAG: response regulator [Bacteroidetes bacterium]|jgi:two-component system LytT family response regulator|nr:response regulator [Bacteroidota bacterium]
MDTIRSFIVDGQAADRQALRALLQEETDIDLVGECTHAVDAVPALQAHRPDLVFMSVSLPDGIRFEVLSSLETVTPPATVFLSVDEASALRAFELHAVDYLLKPIRSDRLREALVQARHYLKGQRMAALYQQIATFLDRIETVSGRTAAFLKRIPVRNGRRVFFVDVSAIDWMEAADNYVCLHVGPRRHFVRSTLSDLDEQLDPAHFLRIHRSRIVNIDRIREIHPRGSGDSMIILDDGTELLSSRTYGDRRRDVLRPFA